MLLPLSWRIKLIYSQYGLQRLRPLRSQKKKRLIHDTTDSSCVAPNIAWFLSPTLKQFRCRCSKYRKKKNEACRRVEKRGKIYNFSFASIFSEVSKEKLFQSHNMQTCNLERVQPREGFRVEANVKCDEIGRFFTFLLAQKNFRVFCFHFSKTSNKRLMWHADK